MTSENLFVWNVRDLNGRTRRNVVREFTAQERVSLVCLQETKLDVVYNQLANEILGSAFDYACLPVINTAGGVLLAWRADVWTVSNLSLQTNSLTVKVQSSVDASPWWITVVYGPSAWPAQDTFLCELESLRTSLLGPWMVCGDFNIIYQAADKSNGRLDRCCMRRFHRFLGAVHLEELHLGGRLFTCSNERVHPTLERIDRAFISVDWLDLYPNHRLRALSSDCSHHAPLLLQTNVVPWASKCFCFETFWTHLPGFLDVVGSAWHPSLLHTDAFRNLDYKFRNVARALKSWSMHHVSSVRLQLAIAREVILRLDAAQDTRALSAEEMSLRKELKAKCLGLASLARTIARQRSRITFLAEGDANTRFFHLQACHRRRKSHIMSLSVDGVEVVHNEPMAAAIFDHFNGLLGQPFQRTARVDMVALGVQPPDLSMLDVCFTEHEVWTAICELPADKAPGPNGFTGLFYKLAWPIIKHDIINAFNAFWSLDGRNFHLINDAFMILLRKKSVAQEIRDYRPISLIRSFSKLVTKCLARRLALVLNDLVHPSQSAFIQGRSIHDNVRSVQLICKTLHRKKKSCLLLKLDIAKAFDSICWPFLLDVLRQMGFSRRWLNWMSILLGTASTRVLLNGRHGERICHA